MSSDISSTPLGKLANLYEQVNLFKSRNNSSKKNDSISDLAHQCLLTCSKKKGVDLTDLKIEKKSSSAWKWFLRIVSLGGYAVYEHFNKLRERTNLEQIRDCLNGAVTKINTTIKNEDSDQIKKAEQFIEFVNAVIQHVNAEYKKSTKSQKNILEEISQIQKGEGCSNNSEGMKAPNLQIGVPDNDERDITILPSPVENDPEYNFREGQARHLATEPIRSVLPKLPRPPKQIKRPSGQVTSSAPVQNAGSANAGSANVSNVSQQKTVQQLDNVSVVSSSAVPVVSEQVSEPPVQIVDVVPESRRRGSTIEAPKPAVSSPSHKKGLDHLLQQLEKREQFYSQRRTRSQDQLFAPGNTEERSDYLIEKAKKEGRRLEWMIIQTNDKKYQLVSVEYSEDDDMWLCDEQEIRINGEMCEVEGEGYPSVDLMLLDRKLLIFEDLDKSLQEELKNKIMLSLSSATMDKEEKKFYSKIFNEHFSRDNYFISEILQVEDCFKLSSCKHDKMSLSYILLQLMIKNEGEDRVRQRLNSIIKSEECSNKLKQYIENLEAKIKK